MAIVKTTVKGQIVIPADIRKKYGIKHGSRVEVIDRGGRIVLRPLLTDPINQACGMFKPRSKEESGLAALIADRREEAKR